MSNSSHRRLTSDIWNHFTKLDKKGKCGYCHRVISAGASISNLKRHLKSKHPTVPYEQSKCRSRSPSSDEEEEVVSSNGVDCVIQSSNDQPLRRSLLKPRTENIPPYQAATIKFESPLSPTHFQPTSTIVGRPSSAPEPEDEFSFFARFLAKRIRSIKDPYWQSCVINDVIVAMHKVEMRWYEPPTVPPFERTTSDTH